MPADRRPVGFYVHHHGSGHATRCKLLAADLPADRVFVFTSAPRYFNGWTGGTVITLPPDWSPDRDGRQDVLDDQILHYAPVNMPELSRRMAILAGWIAERNPERFVVDLSVEVALFVRLCGVRTELVRLHGHRDDPAHRAAFRLADRLIAPFPEQLDDAHTPGWLRSKTTYLAGRSRYDDRVLSRVTARSQLGYGSSRPLAVVVSGRGGEQDNSEYWSTAAHHNPQLHWWIVGTERPDGMANPPNCCFVGEVSDTFPYLRAADVVVGSGGTNTMWEIGAARRPYVSLPEPRPYDEQVCKMRALSTVGLTHCYPELPPPEQWAAIIDRALTINVTGWLSLFPPAQT